MSACGFARGRSGSRSGHLDRHQRHVFAAERAVDERLLLVAGRFEHVVAHEAEGAADVEAGRRQMLRQRDRERAVGAVAVLRREAGLGRIGDQRVGAGRLDLGEAAADAARGDRALHGLAERIVTAGIEDHQAKLLGRLDRDQDAIEGERLVIDVGVALELGVDRDQIVRAFDLDAVAGIIDHGDIGIAGCIGEFAQHAPRFQRRQIVPGIDDVEAGLLQRLRHHRTVIDGVRERRRMLIGGVGDHQRDALSGESGPGAEQQRDGEEKRAKSEQIAHDTTSEIQGSSSPFGTALAGSVADACDGGHEGGAGGGPKDPFCLSRQSGRGSPRNRCAAGSLRHPRCAPDIAADCP